MTNKVGLLSTALVGIVAVAGLSLFFSGGQASTGLQIAAYGPVKTNYDRPPPQGCASGQLRCAPIPAFRGVYGNQVCQNGMWVNIGQTFYDPQCTSTTPSTQPPKPIRVPPSFPK